MNANAEDPSGLDGIPAGAEGPDTTLLDYIIVGSGAGGGPLAARLARAGMNVLVIEAGVDPGAPLPRVDSNASAERAAENERLIYYCPGLHAAATEPHLHSRATPPDPDDPANCNWGFDVRHFSDPTKESAYYPRAAALGGCTAHYAMIATYGADYDWQRMADLTGDDSWAPGKMRAIYQRIERARNGVLAGRFGYYWRWFANWLDPTRRAASRRGESGWLEVTVTDPKLAMKDRSLMRVIARTVVEEEGLTSGRALCRWIKHLLAGSLFRDLDLNDETTMRESPEGVALVPIAATRDGSRRGPRELLLETRRALLENDDPFAGKLRIATGIFVRRVVFDCEVDAVPRAIGVEFQRGRHLYEASPFFNKNTVCQPRLCFAKREVILCGGAFNSPQVLMLSGIGDRRHLAEKNVEGLACVSKAGDTWSVSSDGTIIDLPGVGENLLDRCEISVISEMAKPFESLHGVEFDPNSTSDPALKAWRAEDARPRAGLYTTNGAALAILKRSSENVVQPELLMFGFPVAFRGYYRGWSKDLLARERGAEKRNRNLWSWVILKAYSVNRGSVRLRSNDPSQVPAINFRYFGDSWDAERKEGNIDEKNEDLAALEFGVQYVRRLNRNASTLLKDGDAAAAEVQPGKDKPDGSEGLREWIVQQSWGHHAAGTCRIGSDPWQSNPTEIRDKGAVLDSKFRVHGVRGLRVVDASVFPKIPGYFIAVPIFMISEKAADTILNELSV